MTLDLIIEAVVGIGKLLTAGLFAWAYVGFIFETIEKQYGPSDGRTAKTKESFIDPTDIIPQQKGEGKHEQRDSLQSA